MKEGLCKLCSKMGMLDYEHVPPRSSGIKTTKFRTGSYFDFMTSSDPLRYNIKGRIKQGGIGFNTFCQNCNNFLGRNYVPSYNNWFRAGMSLVNDLESKSFIYDAKKQYPLKTLKQILSMFLAINSEMFLKEDPKIRDFILNPESTELSDNVRLFAYLNRGPSLRYLPLMAKGNLNTYESYLVSEITFPPYGYVLLLNNKQYENRKLTEITMFKTLSEEGSYTLPLRMNVLETLLPMPLDYRTEKEIKT